MRGIVSSAFCITTFSLLSACSSFSSDSSYSSYAYSSGSENESQYEERPTPNYAARMPSEITPQGRRVIVVDPRVHAWGAYNAEGQLVRGGLATAGASWCPDIGRPCRTRTGSFHIQSLGDSSCKSHIYPVGRGGAPMPYCMFFNGGQGLHGSYEVVDGNESHGCVRLHVSDAEWLRFNFASIGTKVIVKPY